MSTPVKRKAGTPLSDAATSPKHTAPGPSSAGPASPKSKSPTPAPGSPAPEVSGVLSGAHWLQQGLPEVDEDELDSTLGSDVESSTASISSSILNYRTVNGRTYHSDSVTDGEYWGPNDEKHLNALEIYAHGLFLMLDEKLHQAPLKDDIKYAVDIGTGQGYWAVDFADEFTNCEVIGTDISPVQPTWCPANLNFQIEDATKEWTFRDNHFDYIHIQFMNGAVEDWTELYKQAYRCCKPGGWIEHIDVSPNILSDDGTVTAGSAMEQYGKILSEAGIKINRRTTTSQDGVQEAGMKEAGFINMTVKDYKVRLPDPLSISIVS